MGQAVQLLIVAGFVVLLWWMYMRNTQPPASVIDPSWYARMGTAITAPDDGMIR